MTNSVLDPSTLDWIGVRFLDPVGRVFVRNETYYRAIYPDRVPYIEKLFESGVIARLAMAGLVLPTSYADLSVQGYGAVLKTDAAPWRLAPHTFTLRTLLAAARCWVAINELLLPDGLGLLDGHLSNFVLVDRCTPKWVDIGSIVRLDDPLTGVAEFVRCQLRPLQLMHQDARLERTARLLIRDGGVSPGEYAALARRVRIPSPVVSTMVSERLAGRAARKLARKGRLATRRLVLRSLRRALAHVDATPGKGFWSDYRGSQVSAIGTPGWTLPATDPRPSKVVELVEKVHPRTVIDIGANDGFFAALVACTGARVLAVDSDAAAVDKFQQWVSQVPRPVEAFACVDTFQTLPYSADLVLGLALVHHIAITQQYKFDYIARRLAEMSRRALITEFMPNGLGQMTLSPDPLPEHYNLHVFLEELRKYFDSVEVVEYERPAHLSPRTLIFCDGRKP